MNNMEEVVGRSVHALVAASEADAFRAVRQTVRLTRLVPELRVRENPGNLFLPSVCRQVRVCWTRPATPKRISRRQDGPGCAETRLVRVWKLKLVDRVQWRVSGKEGSANNNVLVFCSLASKLTMQLRVQMPTHLFFNGMVCVVGIPRGRVIRSG